MCMIYGGDFFSYEKVSLRLVSLRCYNSIALDDAARLSLELDSEINLELLLLYGPFRILRRYSSKNTSRSL